MKVTILRGIPGSGKSTYAATIDDAVVVSADNYFARGGAYTFDASELGAAHAACLRAFLAYLQGGGWTHIVVDNTNTTVAEIAPYYALAEAYGADVEIVTLATDAIDACTARGVHGVPRRVVMNIAVRLNIENSRMPPRWKRTTRRDDGGVR